MRRTVHERFERLIDRDMVHGCWIWIGGGTASRMLFYLGQDGGVVAARRAGWILFRGQVPDGTSVAGTCGDELCVNPDHAELARDMRGLSFEDRFAAKFVRGGEDECWVWQGAGSKDRYGFIYYDENVGQIGAHVASLLIHFGMIPDGQRVLHVCDNKLCVNPKHLFFGTQQDNMDDKVAKGRQAQGEGHGLAKLTAARVREIRTGVAHGFSPTLLGMLYAIDRTYVYSLASGRVWPHAGGVLEGDELESLLAVLRFQQEEYHRERGDRLRAAQKLSVAAHNAKRQPPPAVRACRGATFSCGQEFPNTSEFFYVMTKATGALFGRCKKCHVAFTSEAIRKRQDAKKAQGG